MRSNLLTMSLLVCFAGSAFSQVGTNGNRGPVPSTEPGASRALPLGAAPVPGASPPGVTEEMAPWGPQMDSGWPGHYGFPDLWEPRGPASIDPEQPLLGPLPSTNPQALPPSSPPNGPTQPVTPSQPMMPPTNPAITGD